MTSKLDLKLKVRKIGGWSVHALEFENSNSSLIVLILGKPAKYFLYSTTGGHLYSILRYNDVRLV